MNSELRPCEQATFIHSVYGGPHDGTQHPSQHCYETLRLGGTLYERFTEPERMDEGPPALHVLNCTDDYAEPVFYEVKMRPAT